MNLTAEITSTRTNTIKDRFAIKVAGVGGAGCNALNHIALQALEDVSYAVLNTDAPVLSRSTVANRVVLGATSMRGLGAGGDPERGRAAAEEDAAHIKAFCQGADVLFVVAGLGGGTGTGASPVVARIAQELGALVLAIVFTPFDCEGHRRQALAQTGLEELQAAADGVICLPNQKLFELIGEKTSVVDAFGITNNFVAQAVQSIWRLLSRPGLINVDFADLCSLTRGKHSTGALATAEARGEKRSHDVVEKLLSHPLIDHGQALADAGGLLVAITGGPNLSMVEVNHVTQQIQRCAENALTFMGAAIEPEMDDKITVTLIASGRPSRTEKNFEGPGRNNGRSNGTARFDVETDSMEKERASSGRPSARFVPPPPETTAAKAEQLLAQNGHGFRRRQLASRMRQGQLPLEIISRGRFEKSQPTIHRGEDLDVPTYIRRGIALN